MRTAACLLALLSTAASASAQVGAGAITGVVRDETGLPVPGAAITATEAERNISRTAESSNSGVYALPALAPGVYRIRVELPGFRPSTRELVRVETGSSLRLDFVLAVGGFPLNLTIPAEAPLLREGAAGLGQVIRDETLAALPLNGRSFIALASLAPGVALPPGSQLPRINGGRPRTNEYLFDGISVLQPEPGQVAFFPIVDAIQEIKIETNSPPAEFGRFNGGVVNLTTKAGTNTLHGTGFEFFRHEALGARNVFASTNPVKPLFRRNQFGGVLGGPIQKNRTFFFVDYQGQRQTIGRTVTSTVPTLAERQGVFKQAIYDPATTSGSTRAPFPNNTIPPNRMDPVALALLDRYPLPTSAASANNYRRTANETVDQDQFDVRVDHRLTQDSVFGRLTRFGERFIPVWPLPDGSGVTSGTLGPQDTRAWSFASSYQHVFSGTLLNELRVGDTRRAVQRTPARLSGPVAATPGLPGIPGIPGIPLTAQFPDTLPTFQIGGYQQLGSPPNAASDFSTSVTEVADSLSWLKGRHALKMGFDWRWERLNVVQPPSPTGLFVFNNVFTDLPGVADTGAPLASFLLGQVSTFSIDLQQQQIRNRASFQEYFIQDDWQVSDRLTIAPGLRYTLNFPSVEEHDQSAVFNLETEQLEYLGQNGHPRSARRLHKNNLGPRLGIVGRVTDKTVLSAGYALVWIEMAGITTPFTTPAFPFLQTVSQRTLDNLTPAFVLANGPAVAPIAPTPAAGLGQGVFAVDRDLGSGYVQQWNASFQRELTQRTAVEVAYLGSKISRVGIPDSNLNQLTVEQLALGPSLVERVPNPYFGTIPRSSSLGDPTITVAQLLKPYPAYTTVSLYRNNVGTTFYQGVTAKIEQRASRGFTYLVSYTRSKLVDDASTVFDASILTGPVANFPVADSFNRKGERDYSTGDITHILVGSFSWELPMRRGTGSGGWLRTLGNDWRLAAIVTLQSGVPVAVTQATNFNAFAGFGIQRPNLVGNPELPSGERSAARWFNTAAFVVAPVFTVGSASRNPVRGPAYRNVDLALGRRFGGSNLPAGSGTTSPAGSGFSRMLSSLSLELRVEVFNLLNTPPLGNPNAVLGAANFGTITTALDPRVVQLAVKLLF